MVTYSNRSLNQDVRLDPSCNKGGSQTTYLTGHLGGHLAQWNYDNSCSYEASTSCAIGNINSPLIVSTEHVKPLLQNEEKKCFGGNRCQEKSTSLFTHILEFDMDWDLWRRTKIKKSHINWHMVCIIGQFKVEIDHILEYWNVDVEWHKAC